MLPGWSSDWKQQAVKRPLRSPELSCQFFSAFDTNDSDGLLSDRQNLFHNEINCPIAKSTGVCPKHLFTVTVRPVYNSNRLTLVTFSHLFPEARQQISTTISSQLPVYVNYSSPND